ncbi:MAG: ankyrin repeat domain-containing protein [Candidatus Chromulinivorax sp.]
MKRKIITYFIMLLGTIYLESTVPVLKDLDDNTVIKDSYDNPVTKDSTYNIFATLYLHLYHNNYEDFVSTLQEFPDFNIDIQDQNGSSILHYAVSFNEDGETQFIKEILNRNANINIENFKGMTPLLEALYNENIKLAEFLINNKADTNIDDTNKIVLLQLAIIHTNFKMVQFLIHNFFDNNSINLLNSEYKTPLDYAFDMHSFNPFNDEINMIIDFLRANGAKSALEIQEMDIDYDSEVESINSTDL